MQTVANCALFTKRHLRNLHRARERQGKHVEEHSLNARTASSSEDPQQLKIIRGQENISVDNFTKFTVFLIFPRHPGVALVGEQMLH